MPMKLNLFVEIKYQSSTIILSADIIYSVHFVTLLTIPGPQTGDMRYIR